MIEYIFNMKKEDEKKIPYRKLNKQEKEYLHYYCFMKMRRIHRQEYYDKIIYFFGKNLCCIKSRIKPTKKKYLDPIVFKLIEHIIKSEPTITNKFLDRAELLDTHIVNLYLDDIKKYGLKKLSMEQIAELLISLIKSYNGLFHRELAYPIYKAIFIEPGIENYDFFEYYMKFAFTEDERKLFRELKSMFIHLSRWKYCIMRNLIFENADLYFPKCKYFRKKNHDTQIELINYFNEFNFHEVPRVLVKKANNKLEKIMAKKNKNVK